MEINMSKIKELVNKYKGCILEEIYENHKVMGNWVTITCDLQIEELNEMSVLAIGSIYDLIDELDNYDNIIDWHNETYENINDNSGEYPFFELISFSWVI